MQFDPVALMGRVNQLEKMVFGKEVPAFVTAPTKENPNPPIKQVQATNPETGALVFDRFNQPVMVDLYDHEPGLLDVVASLREQIEGGNKSAGVGGATSASAHAAALAPIASKPAKKKK